MVGERPAGDNSAHAVPTRKSRRPGLGLFVVLPGRHRALRLHRSRNAHRAALHPLAARSGANQRRVRVAGRRRAAVAADPPRRRLGTVRTDSGGDPGAYLHAAAARVFSCCALLGAGLAAAAAGGAAGADCVGCVAGG